MLTTRDFQKGFETLSPWMRSNLKNPGVCAWRFSFAPCKRIRIPEPGKFLLFKSGILGFGIRNIGSITSRWSGKWARTHPPPPPPPPPPKSLFGEDQRPDPGDGGNRAYPEYSSRNPESQQRLESGIQVPLKKTRSPTRFREMFRFTVLCFVVTLSLSSTSETERYLLPSRPPYCWSWNLPAGCKGNGH